MSSDLFSPEYYRFTHRAPGWGKLDEDYLQSNGIEQTPGAETYFLQDPWGGRLSLEVTGEEDGYAVLMKHGQPGGRRGPKPVGDNLPAGVRLFAWERPGYGYSTPWLGFRPVDAVEYGRMIVRYFGLNKISVVGRSGGAPSALAMAARLKEVERAAVVVPAAPYGEMGESWFDGMGEFNTLLFRRALDELWTHEHPQKWTRGKKQPDISIYGILQELSEEIRRQMAAAAEGKTPSENLAAGINAVALSAHADALQYGVVGRINDIFAINNWGFRLSEIKEVPTLVWAADQDPFTPTSHAKFIASRVGSSVLHIQQNTNHYDGVDATADAIQWCYDGRGQP